MLHRSASVEEGFWAKEMAIGGISPSVTNPFLDGKKVKATSDFHKVNLRTHVPCTKLEIPLESDKACKQGIEAFHRLMTAGCSWKFYACVGLLGLGLLGVAAGNKYDLLGPKYFAITSSSDLPSSTALSILPPQIDLNLDTITKIAQAEPLKPDVRRNLSPQSGCESVVIDLSRRERDTTLCSSRTSTTNNLSVKNFDTEASLHTIIRKFPNLKALEVDYGSVTCGDGVEPFKTLLNTPFLELQDLNKLTIKNNRNCLHLSPVLTFKAPQLHTLQFDNVQLNTGVYEEILKFIKPACSQTNSNSLNIQVLNSRICSSCMFSWLDSYCPNLGNRSFLGTDAFEEPTS